MNETMVDPYAQPAHEEWVASGKCPVISWSKAWCSGDAGHTEDHHSPRDLGGGRTQNEFWTREWTR